MFLVSSGHTAHHHSCWWTQAKVVRSELSVEVPIQSSFFLTVTPEKLCMRLKSLSGGSGENVGKEGYQNLNKLNGERRAGRLLGTSHLHGGSRGELPMAALVL